MIKTTLSNFLSLLLIAILLSACATLPSQKNAKMTNMYQHRWVKTSTPHVDQNLNSVAKFLTDYDVVFFGELHSHPGVHLAQMQLFEAMYNLNPKLSLSLEQFERDTQTYVDDYLQGKIGEKHLIRKTRAWDNYPTSYRPLVEFAKQNQLPVVAANAPKSTVVCVGRIGLEFMDNLTPQDRLFIAKDIDISDGAYRKRFMSFITNNASHGSTSDNKMSDMMKKMSERSYAAQVVRDDTMAESIALHLQQNPGRQVLHLNGSFHSSNFLGAVERLASRMPKLKIAVVETITTAADDNYWKTEELDSGNLLLLVNLLPIDFINHENEIEFSKAILKKRKSNGVNCDKLQQLTSGS